MIVWVLVTLDDAKSLPLDERSSSRIGFLRQPITVVYKANDARARELKSSCVMVDH